MAEILKGAPVSEALCEKVRERAAALRARGVAPTLALVRVGDDDSDIYYERSVMRRAGGLGVEVRNVLLPADAAEEALLSAVYGLNADPSVHGVLIFRPLPKHIDDNRIRAALSPDKDVDGITDGSLAGVFTGSGAGYCPCTAEAAVEILKHYGIPMAGARAVVVGRSLVIGKPVSQLLLRENATVTVCHTRTRDLAAETKRADIVIAAAGARNAITISHVSPGQTIIDVGINTDEDGKMVGDVAFQEVEPFVGAITPVPGGVGAVTTALLFTHVVDAAEKLTV